MPLASRNACTAGSRRWRRTNSSTGTVAKQHRRHAHSQARIVDPKAEAAKIDGEEQHMRRRHGLSVATRSREPGNAAATTEPEDRQTLDRRRQIEPVHQLRIKARYGKHGEGVDDDGAEILALDARGTDGTERNRSEERRVGKT